MRFPHFAILPLLLFACLAASAEARQPNIILIMADDVGWECFGAYGSEEYQTPHLDRLAREGMRFDHAYSTPLCTPTRVKLMTGKYNFRNYTHFGYLNPGERTFGHMMQDAGYRTAIAGKWQLNGIYNSLPGHDDSTRPLQAGFHEALLWQVTKGKQPKDGGGERYWNPPLERNGEFVSRGENWGKYGPDLFTDFICDFMERNQDEPFFVYYPMVLVHDVFVPTPDTLGDTPLEQANIQPADTEGRKANFVAMVRYMDKLVGRIAAKAEELGLAKDTLILFTADNGTHTSLTSNWRGYQIRGGKGGPTDRGTHVPLIAYWPGTVASGSVNRDLIDFTDFYPTFAEMADSKLGQDDPNDGRSVLPQLRGKPGRPRPVLLIHYQPYWGPEPSQFVRTQTHKLYGDGRAYDVAADLFESADLSQTLAWQQSTLRHQLQSILDSLPPLPPGRGQANRAERPIYPDWPLPDALSH